MTNTEPTNAVAEPVYVEGIDISRYQGDVDFDEVRNAGAKFAFLKATEGVGWTDPTFYRNAARAAHNGVLCGTYHFFRADEDPAEQARHYAKVAEDCCSLRPVCDFENQSMRGVNPSVALARAREFMVRTVDLWECAPILYTGPAFMAAFRPYQWPEHELWDLWIAHYTKQPAPIIPRPWPKWLLWQYDGDGGRRLPVSKIDTDWDRIREEDFGKLLRSKESLFR